MTSSPAASEAPAEFKLAGTPGGVNVVIFAVLFLIATGGGLLVWSAFGGPSLEDAFLMGLVGLAILSGWAGAMLLAGRGSVKMSADGLRIESYPRVKVLRWEHIAGVTVERCPSTWFAPALREGPPYLIKVSLSRRLRYNFHPWHWETRGLGIPTPAKTIQFQVEEKDRFLSAARSFMKGGNASS